MKYRNLLEISSFPVLPLRFQSFHSVCKMSNLHHLCSIILLQSTNQKWTSTIVWVTQFEIKKILHFWGWLLISSDKLIWPFFTERWLSGYQISDTQRTICLTCCKTDIENFAYTKFVEIATYWCRYPSEDKKTKQWCVENAVRIQKPKDGFLVHILKYWADLQIKNVWLIWILQSK